MRQIVTNVYKYDELSDENKERAWRNIVSDYLDPNNLKRVERKKLRHELPHSIPYLKYDEYPTSSKCEVNVYNKFTVGDLLDFVSSDIPERVYKSLSCLSDEVIDLEPSKYDSSVCRWNKNADYERIIESFINTSIELWCVDIFEENHLTKDDIKNFVNVLCKKMTERCKYIEDLFKEFYRRKDDVALELCDKYLIEFYDDGTIFKGIKSENSDECSVEFYVNDEVVDRISVERN